MDSLKCPTTTASPAEPGELQVVLERLPSIVQARHCPTLGRPGSSAG
jgi:hypothetical protein